MFWGWGGACSGTGACNLTITGDTSVIAEFDQSACRYTVTATTLDPSFFSFDVTYPVSTTSTSDCVSSTTGSNCSGSLPRGTVVTLVAHVPSLFPAVWHDVPTWTGCDAVSIDNLKCTFTLLSMRHITVSGDTAQGP